MSKVTSTEREAGAVVVPIAGEFFRFYVTSQSQPEFPHLVDLEPYGWNGQCDCEHFRFRLEPELARGRMQASRAARCWHIRLARETMLVDLLPRLRRSLNNQETKADSDRITE